MRNELTGSRPGHRYRTGPPGAREHPERDDLREDHEQTARRGGSSFERLGVKTWSDGGPGSAVRERGVIRQAEHAKVAQFTGVGPGAIRSLFYCDGLADDRQIFDKVQLLCEMD